MQTFEIWNTQSNGYAQQSAQHIVEAADFYFKDGAYIFTDEKGNRLHAVVATPGMFVRTVRKKG